MNRYFALFKMRLIAGMQYRAAAWAGISTQFFFGFVFIMVYIAFYQNATVQPAMTLSQTVSYMWLKQAFLAIIALWVVDGDLLNQIKSGHIAYELCRPYHMFTFWYVRLLANRLSNVALRFLPILVISLLLPHPYKMMLPPNIGAGLLFLLSLSLATLLIVAISMFIYIITFLTMSQVSARTLIGVPAEFLSGALIPIPLMPQVLQDILKFLPFAYITDLPFRIYSGNIVQTDALFGIFIQILWIIVMIGFGAWSFKRIMGKIIIQGG